MVPFSRIVPALAIALIALLMPVYGQTSIPCSASMVTSFTPCLNYVTNSTTNGSSPTADCCNSLKSLMSSGTDCMCNIVTGNVPFQVPINRTLAISLPRACNMPGVPLQCKAAVSPIASPGPAAALSPPSPASPQASTVPESVSPALAPESDTTPALTPPSVSSTTPTSSSGSRPVLTPSAADPTYSRSPILLLAVIGATLFKFY